MHYLHYLRPPFTGQLLKPDSPPLLWALGILGDFFIIGAILFWLLNLIPARLRKKFIMALTFLAGLIYSVEFFIPADPETHRNVMTAVTDQVGRATNVVYAFALGLGVLNLIRFHGANLMRRRAGWHNNLAFFIAFFVMMGAGFWQYAAPTKMSVNAFNMLFISIVAALGATMFSTIGFFIISAAYRAFRIRSGEATLMLAAAFVVMLGQVPAGTFLTNGIPQDGWTSLFRLENMSYWILNQPNMAAQRGIYFGVEVGALAMALRTWLSLERGSFFEREL